MRLMTKNADYAITALCTLARQPGRMLTAGALARELKISHAFLRKLFQLLERRGVVNSRKGRGGGFALAAPPDRITLSAVMEAVQGPVTVGDCLVRRKVCPRVAHCVLRRKLQGIEQRLVGELNALTIASLISQEV
jgi:Rrf2 family transcriptional regulator, cysteine metabolism repressor